MKYQQCQSWMKHYLLLTLIKWKYLCDDNFRSWVIPYQINKFSGKFQLNYLGLFSCLAQMWVCPWPNGKIPSFRSISFCFLLQAFEVWVGVSFCVKKDHFKKWSILNTSEIQTVYFIMFIDTFLTFLSKVGDNFWKWATKILKKRILCDR